jgi:hypothetical protein
MESHIILDYLKRVHERTRRIVLLVASGDTEWAPKAEPAAIFRGRRPRLHRGSIHVARADRRDR